MTIEKQRKRTAQTSSRSETNPSKFKSELEDLYSSNSYWGTCDMVAPQANEAVSYTIYKFKSEVSGPAESF